MEISKLRLDLEKSTKPLADAQSRVTTLEEELAMAEEANAALTAQVDELKQKLEKASEQLVTEVNSRETTEAKLAEKDAQVEILSATVKKLEAQVSSWEKDHSTLKHLYKETDTLAQDAQKKATSLEAENAEMKKQVQELLDLATSHRRGTGSMQADDDILDTLENDELQKHKRRIRELETLLEESRHPPHKGHRRMASEKAGFQEVQFLGNFPSIEDDEDFLPSTDDEGMAGRAEAEEAERRRREERLVELKKGLEKWRGYRLDLTTVPGRAGWGAHGGWSEMFEV